MNLAVFNIQDWTSFFKHEQRWAVGWASGYDNMLSYYKMHFKASAEGYKAPSGCCKMSAKLCFRPVEIVRRTSNGGCLVNCIIVPVVLNKQLWHAGRWCVEAGGFTLINGQQQPCAMATEDTVTRKSTSDILVGKGCLKLQHDAFFSSFGTKVKRGKVCQRANLKY